jgi:hypothetical protein
MNAAFRHKIAAGGELDAALARQRESDALSN